MTWVDLATVKPEAIDWVWRDHLAAGYLTVLEAPGGVGKGLLYAAVVAHLTTGRSLPGDDPRAPCGALVVGAEDGIADELVPRLVGARCDLARVRAREQLHLPDELALLEYAIRSVRARVLVLDPLSSVVNASGRESGVRAGLLEILTLCRREGCAVLAIRHLTKDGKSGLGSVAVQSVSRWTFGIRVDAIDPTVRHLELVKTNRRRPDPVRFRVGVSPANGAPRAYFLGVPVRTHGDVG